MNSSLYTHHIIKTYYTLQIGFLFVLILDSPILDMSNRWIYPSFRTHIIIKIHYPFVASVGAIDVFLMPARIQSKLSFDVIDTFYKSTVR